MSRRDRLIAADRRRLATVKSLLPAVTPDPWSPDVVRAYRHPGQSREILYYVVPFQQSATGRLSAYIDAETGKILSVRSRGLKLHCSRARSGRVTPMVVMVVDMLIHKLREENHEQQTTTVSCQPVNSTTPSGES